MGGGIYTITSPSGGQYVGSAISISDRWRKHRKDLRDGAHPNKRLTAAFKKYGGKLTFAKLLICAPDMLLFYEQRAIDILKPRYNCRPVAGSNLGLRQSQETKAKVSAAGKKHWASAGARAEHSVRMTAKLSSPEVRAKMSASQKARVRFPYTSAVKAKISEIVRARLASPEVVARMSAAQKKRAPASEETRRRMSLSHKARLSSPEARARASASVLKGWETRRQNR